SPEQPSLAESPSRRAHHPRKGGLGEFGEVIGIPTAIHDPELSGRALELKAIVADDALDLDAEPGIAVHLGEGVVDRLETADRASDRHLAYFDHFAETKRQGPIVQQLLACFH